jgi:transcriptional regulator with XRE-family HTH domain
MMAVGGVSRRGGRADGAGSARAAHAAWGAEADPHAVALGQRLRQATADRGLKQADIVRALGAPQGTISRYFSGTRGVSDHNRLDAIAAVLGVSYEWLAFGRGPPSYDPHWRRPPSRARKPATAGGGPGDDAYVERRRALAALHPHLQGDQERVRELLLLLTGPPYDTWTHDQWEAEALRQRDRLAALDAQWRAPAPARGEPERRSKPKKSNVGAEPTGRRSRGGNGR